ncbi:MAG TPA: hypothetical protein DHV42_02385 [Lachnospiraceae bacterium]|nr:hypothetical protein [Lachnospiraceae bacterium]
MNSFNWNCSIPELAERRTGGRQARLHLANTAMRFMRPYVPAEQVHVLAGSAHTYVDSDGNGVVEYNTPYAHYQYEGILYVSSVTGSAWARAGEYKVPASPEKALTHVTAFEPLATSHWDEAMMAARKGDLTKSYQNYLNRRGS